MNGITDSVGLAGKNRLSDVAIVQKLLQNAGVSPGKIDGRCGRLTIHAIEQFQRGFLPRPDGLVEVHGLTMQRLLGKSPATGPGTKTPGLTIPAVIPSKQPAPSQSAAMAHVFWSDVTPLPDPSVNRGVTCPRSADMMAILGDPHDERAQSHIATEAVGPFRATGLKPALASLRSIFTEVGHDLPDLYNLVGNNGMHVIRNTRGRSSYSNHAWGIAIDLLIDHKAPPLGARNSIRGLDALLPYFHKAGWYWGGGYHNADRKDPMHFECGLDLVRSFAL